MIPQLLAILLYFFALTLVVFFSYRKNMTDTDFILGNRSMNFWLTALAAHASDMSSWLFMAYPATIFACGLHQAWAGIGLFLFMLLNWQFIAAKVRTATEEYQSMTFSSFFENRFADRSGKIRIITALMLFFFYTIYISAALVSLGYVLDTLFGLPYHVGVLLGIAIIIPYVFMGGFLTLAWIDLFQGMFLLACLLFVPLYLLPSVGGLSGLLQAVQERKASCSLLPDRSFASILNLFFLAIGWGLGYLGQPHIITKFMGIRQISEIRKAKYIGMSWMALALGAATFVGLLSVPFFKEGIRIDEEVFVQMVKQSFSPFVAALILCAIFAATINAISSMVLVLASSFSEDLYKRLINPKASSKTLLKVSRIGVITTSLIALSIALIQFTTIHKLVLYAWSGLGASFGPLLLGSLYMKKANRYGAWTAIISGGSLAALWPTFNQFIGMDIPALIPSFFTSLFLLWAVSFVTNKRETSQTV